MLKKIKPFCQKRWVRFCYPGAGGDYYKYKGYGASGDSSHYKYPRAGGDYYKYKGYGAGGNYNQSWWQLQPKLEVIITSTKAVELLVAITTSINILELVVIITSTGGDYNLYKYSGAGVDHHF